MVKRISALLAALVLMLSVSAVAFAHEVPDTERDNCSIRVVMHIGDTKIPGGTLQLYRVGGITENDGGYSWTPSGDFADCGLSFADVQSPELAQDLAKLAAKKTPLAEEKVGEDCTVAFTGLETGLYLVVQSKAAPGYEKAEPFLVSVPYYEDGSYKYDVEAWPKVEIEKETPPPTPAPPATKPPEKLPQTGQTNWPVPLLMVLGLALMIAGWILRYGRKSGAYEE